VNTLTLKITGTAPILLNNARLVNKLDPMSKALAIAVSKMKKDKTDEAVMQAARIEWEAGLYMDPKHGPVIPGLNVQRAIVEGARQTKNGKIVERGVRITEISLPLKYEGPREVDAMWDDGRFVDQRSCGVVGRRVIRTRPVFPEWSVEATFVFDPEQIDRDTLIEAARTAGTRIGIGNFRPDCGGIFGTFDVDVVA